MAGYNPGFPTSYQPYYQQYFPQMQTQPTNNGGMIWVQGEAGAKSYLVAPNATVQLWDSEAQVIYLKSADASGMPSMKVLDYTIRGTEAPALTASTDYVTRQELEQLEQRINERLEKAVTRRKANEDEPTV